MKEVLDCGLQKPLSYLHNASRVFLQIAADRILEPGLNEQYDSKQTDTDKGVFPSFSPTGWIVIQQNFFHTQDSCFKGETFHVLIEWLFLLDAKIATNFTFDKMVLPVAFFRAGYMFVSCRSFSLEPNTGRCPHYLLQMKQKSSDVFHFSGWHPTFNFYPTFKMTYLSLCLSSNANFEIIMFSKVMDKGIAESMRTHHKYPNEVMFLICYYRMIVHKFHLVGYKLSQIVITVQGLKFGKIAVIDGPCSEDEILRPKDTVFVTTTFQCLVVTKEPDHKGITNQGQKIFFLFFKLQVLDMKRKAKYKTANLNNHVKNFPGKRCWESPCFMVLAAERPHHVNITILQIKISMHNTDDCSLHGIAIIDKSDMKEEISLVCAQFPDSNTNNGRSLYSNAPETIVFIYWYKCTSDFQIKLHLGQTRCFVVYVDPCKFEEFCGASSLAEGNLCHVYLDKLNQRSTIRFSHELDTMKFLFGATLSYTPTDFNCSIIHISQVKTVDQWKWFVCTMNLNLGTTESKNVLAHHDIRSRSGTRTQDCFFHLVINDPKQGKFSKNVREQTKSPVCVEDIGQTRYTRVNISGPIRGQKLKFERITFIGKSEMWHEFMVRVVPVKTTQDVMPHEVFTVGKKSKRALINLDLQSMHHYFWLESEQPGILPHLFCDIDMDLKEERFSRSKNPCVQMREGHQQNTFKVKGHASLSAFHLGVPFSFLDLLNLFFITQGGIQERSFFAVTWVWGHYKSFQSFFGQSGEECCKVPTSLDLQLCMNFTINKGNQYYLFIEKQIMFVPSNHNGHQRGSWNGEHSEVKYKSWRDAFQICQELGGHLPVFISKQRVDQFLALIKLSEFPHLVALYIGLIQKQVCTFSVAFDIRKRTIPFCYLS